MYLLEIKYIIHCAYGEISSILDSIVPTVYLFMFSAISSPVLYLINPEYHPFMPLVHLFASLYYSITIFFIYFVLCIYTLLPLPFLLPPFSLEGSLTLSKIKGQTSLCHVEVASR